MNPNRVRTLKKEHLSKGPVLYWMSRDQRVSDNWALLYAQALAMETSSPLSVVFTLSSTFLDASWRHYAFMLKGLRQVEKALSEKGIPFQLLLCDPPEGMYNFINTHRVAALVTDFDPLKIKREWKRQLLEKVTIPVYEVDTHNIVPAWIVSDKQEYAARTIRPRIHRVLDDYLEPVPRLVTHPYNNVDDLVNIQWKSIESGLTIDRSVQEVHWIQPGERAAETMLDEFISERLHGYNIKRNDPNLNGQSNLSPYLHFGQLSAQRVAWDVSHSDAPEEDVQAFIEELVVRRELSDNWCFYNHDYDTFKGFPNWAQITLNDHRADPRNYLYTLEQFEQASTHNPLWNAAQIEMVKTGKMHGYMRMFWAKKILEWSSSPEEALQIAITLNDTYSLDGRDPNGYAGIAWSIGGVHDQAWRERDIFGKIRYMNTNGCKRKFDIKRYIITADNL